MRKKGTGYAAWLLLTACLYFFENSTGTRIILCCSLLSLLLPFLRRLFLTADAPETPEETEKPLTVKTFQRAEEEEPGEIRAYQPGDPVRRIHWKLSAKKDELLIRDIAAAPEEAEGARDAAIPEEAEGARDAAAREEPDPARDRTEPGETKKEPKAPAPAKGKRKAGKRAARVPLCLAALGVALLLLIPEARHGAEALCNRIFAESEKINAYAYVYFPVAENQSTTLAAALLIIAPGCLTAGTMLLRSRGLAMGITAAYTLFQVYFGLPFPAWINLPLYGLTALWMMKRPIRRRDVTALAGLILTGSLAIVLLIPGTDAATEAASETVRDHLSRRMEEITGIAPETPEGETETRHLHTQSLTTGENEARADREYRLETVEEEQISMPHWINWMKMILMLLLTVALVSLPFAPFLLLNARKKKALERRKPFTGDDTGEAVRAIFGEIIHWMNETGHDGRNLLYRERVKTLPEGMPEGYALRFAACAADYEEAVYSAHILPEEKRQRALALLKETENALWSAANRKQRLRIRYWMCLRE